VIGIAILALFVTLGAYLWYIQLVRGEEFLRMAVNNRMRLVRRPGPRGRILDRWGRILVDNRPSFDIEVAPEDVPDRGEMEREIGKILNMSPAEVRKRIHTGRVYPYLPIVVERDVDMETVLAIEERQPLFAGVQVGVSPRRNYVYGGLAANVLGYLGLIGKEELELRRDQGYTQQDLVGKSGVEKYYDRFLAGSAGVDAFQVDSRGFRDKVIYKHDASPGNNVYLTIDWGLQRAAEKVLNGQPGAVAALDPRNGEVLAMASSPSYDPGVFVPPADSGIVSELMSDEEYPLLNRAIQGLYPPGSTFKTIVSLAALESGTADKDTIYNCPGYFMLGRHRYHCWYERGHGGVCLSDAIMFSCNVFFYNLGLRTGREEIVRMASLFGVNELSGIDLPGEKAGVLPTDDWCRENGVKSWNPGDTVVLAIGQGYLLLSPIRSALVIAAIANGGSIYRPHVVRQVVSPLGDRVEAVEPQCIRKIPLREQDLALVREGLRKVVNSKFGTGQKCRLEGVEIAGKTGTVQVGPKGQRRNHAWFVGYAPFENPTIALAVLLEGKKSGGYFAAPAAKEIFEAYFNTFGRKGARDD